jgi:hypothetical protein
MQLKFLSLSQTHDRGRSEGLAEAGDPEEGGGGDRLARLQIGMPEAACVDEPAPVAHGQGRAGRLVLLHETMRQLIVSVQTRTRLTRGIGVSTRSGK